MLPSAGYSFKTSSPLVAARDPTCHTRSSTGNDLEPVHMLSVHVLSVHVLSYEPSLNYEGWNFNSGNYLFTTDTK